MMTRSFELTDGKSDKFWTITLEGEQYTVQFGRRGTAGQTQTKEIGSQDAARQAVDKLIAEKLKKGYTEVGAGRNGAAKAAGPAPSKPVAIVRTEATELPAKAAPVVQTESAVPQPPPAPQPAARPPALQEPPLDVSPCPIHLEPADWMVATWRPRQPVPRPEPQPFNRKAALALFQRWIEMGARQHWWASGWNQLELPGSMSREDALFWFHAIPMLMRVMYFEHLSPGTVDWQKRMVAEAGRCLEEIAALDLSRDLPLSVAAEMIRKGRPCALLFIALFNLYPAHDAIEILVEAGCRPDWHDLGEDCMRAGVLQYLGNEDFEFLREEIRKGLATQTPAPVQVPGGGRFAASSYLFRLAAVVGVGDEVTKLVASFPGVLYHAFVYSHRTQDIVFGLPSAALVSEHMRRLRLRLTTPSHIRGWLAHTELTELEFVRHCIVETTNRKEATELLAAFAQAVAAPEAAPVMLSLALESKAPQVARQWLMEHPAETIAGLEAIAAGKGRLADAAIDILRDLDRAGHAPALQARLAPEILHKVAAYRQAANGAEIAVLDAASTPAGLAVAFAEAARIKAKLPTWAAPAMLPPVLTEGGRLNDDQTSTVLRALANSVLPVPHPLLLALLSYATPGSLERFAWTLFERWLADGAPAKEKWALGAVGLYGGDQSAISLAGLIRVWPGEGKHQTAVMGLECLRAIGTNTALVQISGISQRVKFQAIKERAKVCMEEIAADLNLTRPQLEDLVVPDCGLDEQGSRVFDFGPRQFRLILGPGLKPLVVDADNQRKPDLPKPNSKDDAAKAEEAVADWKMVKKQLAEVVKVETRRLEQALVTQRRWTRDEFERLFLRHPFLMNMAPWLVWGAFGRDGKLAATFRVTEDRSLGDEHDRPIQLPSGAAIGLVHPMQLEPASLAAWGELFSDYEILPPFPQLGRPVLRLTEAEARADALQRHAGVVIPPASLVGTLERLGWQRSAVGDGGMYDWHGKEFSEAGVSAILEHGSIIIGMMAESEDTSIEACYFVNGTYDRRSYGAHGSRVPLKKIDPLILSEVLSDLATVASKGKD